MKFRTISGQTKPSVTMGAMRELLITGKGAFNNYVDKIGGGGGRKKSVFVHAQVIKTVHTGGEGRS